MKSAAPYPCVIAAAGIGEIVVENSRASIPECDFDVGNAAQDLGVPFFHHDAETPFGILEMHDLVA